MQVYDNWREMCADLAMERDRLAKELAKAKEEIKALEERLEVKDG